VEKRLTRVEVADRYAPDAVLVTWLRDDAVDGLHEAHGRIVGGSPLSCGSRRRPGLIAGGQTRYDGREHEERGVKSPLQETSKGHGPSFYKGARDDGRR